nr:MAG TPA: hypothetical protein [Caudoviricetes sp.]
MTSSEHRRNFDGGVFSHPFKTSVGRPTAVVLNF